MLAIYLIHKMVDRKQDSSCYTEGLLYHGSLQNRL
jgi:hypothetical protein